MHHAWTRGLDRRAIFHDDRDRGDFLARLEHVLPASGTRCFAWSFLSNHVHLVLQSGEKPIGAVLQRITTGFALRFNLRHDRVGYVFQSRFGSRRVASNADLMNLIRYVHLNPVRAGLIAGLGALDAYPWSGHAALMGRRPPLAFESVTDVLQLFDADVERARPRLLDWMRREEEVPRSTPLASAPDGGRPRDLAELIQCVCEGTGVSQQVLLSGSRNRAVCRARSVICHLAVCELGLGGQTVAAALRVTPGAVTQLVRRGAATSRETAILKS